MRIYWDECCLNRLTDDQSQPRVREEAEAIEQILRMVRQGLATWVKQHHSARPLCLDLCEHRLRNAEAGLSKLSDCVIEVDEPGLFSVIENRKRAGYPQASPNGFLPPSLFINEQQVGMHRRRERDRLTLSRIELNRNQAGFRIYDFHPRRCIDGPVVDRFRREEVSEFRQDCRWNENPLV